MRIRKVPAAGQRGKQQKKVAAYCRVSTGRTEQEESLEIQQEYYSKYITGNSEWVFAGVYSDARSGLSAEKRPGFLKMIQDAEAGKIDVILCKSISRFSRNITECQRYTSRLSSKNVTVVFEKERLRTDEPTSNLVFSLMCAVAQDESRSISENLKTAIQHAGREYRILETLRKKLRESITDLSHARGQFINVGCMMPWMDYTPRTLDEIIKGEALFTDRIEPKQEHIPSDIAMGVAIMRKIRDKANG